MTRGSWGDFAAGGRPGKAHVARPKDKQMELELRAIRDALRSKD